MALSLIELSPGFYRNGTPYSKRGRYQKGSLVRYHNGSYRPVGGWLRRQEVNSDTDIAALIADADLEAVRDIYSWRDNNQALNALFFSNLKVYHLDSVGVVTDITPAGYSATNSSKDAQTTTAYGLGPYGQGAYGVASELTGEDIVPPNRWYADTFGEIALFGSINNGDVYELDLATLTTSVVTNAPTDNADLCVSEERQVFIVGADGDPRRVRASAIEDRTSWTPATSNNVINRVLPGSGDFLRCVPIINEILIIGEDDAHAARYIGPPYVYSIDEVGSNCGPIAAQAVCAASNLAVWWGKRNFWLYSGALQELPCAVLDFLYDDLNPNQVSKISCFTNTEYSEVWWLYQSLSSTTDELDSYVTWDYRTKVWHTGRLSRTAGEDASVFTTPVMVDPDGQIFNHELDNVFPLNEGDVFIETGPIDIQIGEKNMAVRKIFPDVETLTGMEFTLFGRQFPSATEYTYGPYTARNPTPTRAKGRSIRIKTEFMNKDSELGNLRLDLAPIGTGKR